MAKDPAFLFYPGDWQGGTSTFSRFLKGCYMDVLIAQFNSGHLSLDEIKTVLGSDFGSAWPTLQKKFSADEKGLLFNEKLENEIIKRRLYSESRRKNRENKTHVSTHETHMLARMEIENGIEDVIGIELKKESKKVSRESISKFQLHESLFSDDLFVEELTRTHKGKNLNQAFDECYIHHSAKPNPPRELWEWKQKLNTWLTIKDVEKVEQNGKPKTSLADLRKFRKGNV